MLFEQEDYKSGIKVESENMQSTLRILVFLFFILIIKLEKKMSEKIKNW